MRRLLAVLIFLLLAAMVMPPGGWKRVTSRACRASFSLPQAVQADTSRQSLSGGGHLTLYKYDVVKKRNLYDVTCGVYPTKRLRTDEQRQAVLADMTKRLKKKGNVLQSGKVDLAGHTGREVLVARQGGEAVQYHRLLVVGRRLLILTAGRWKRVPPDEDVALRHFFGALKLWAPSR